MWEESSIVEPSIEVKEERIDKVIAVLRKGWIQGRLFDVVASGGMGYCIQGAVMCTLEGHPCTHIHLANDWLWREVSSVCQELHGRGPIDFNDKMADSVDDVIALLEKVRADL